MKSSSNFGALMGLILASAFAESLKSSPKADKDAAPETRANNSLNDLLDSIEKQLGEFTGTDCVGDCADCASADKPKKPNSYRVGLDIRAVVAQQLHQVAFKIRIAYVKPDDFILPVIQRFLRREHRAVKRNTHGERTAETRLGFHVNIAIHQVD